MANSGGTYPMPPRNATEFQPRRYASNATTPAAARRRKRCPAAAEEGEEERSRATSQSGASPSDMFGGVDALLKEANDWVYRDQAQFALGFDNWNMVESDGVGWLDGSGVKVGVGDGVGGYPVSGMVGGFDAVGGGGGGSGTGGGNGMDGGNEMDGGNGMDGIGGGNGMGGMDRTDAMNGMNGFQAYGSMNGYDENEWYR
ncbi:hypothetical protein LTR28_011849 [Elasticomyces elasticus]|nr:hypothetical protein LTR28_011849 [Elasticomyces elasticus]